MSLYADVLSCDACIADAPSYRDTIKACEAEVVVRYRPKLKLDRSQCEFLPPCPVPLLPPNKNEDTATPSTSKVAHNAARHTVPPRPLDV